MIQVRPTPAAAGSDGSCRTTTANSATDPALRETPEIPTNHFRIDSSFRDEVHRSIDGVAMDMVRLGGQPGGAHCGAQDVANRVGDLFCGIGLRKRSHVGRHVLAA